VNPVGGFEPTRLKLARLRRGFTSKALAAEVGVSAQAITSFESGSRAPSPQTVDSLSFALHFPRAFFLGDEVEVIGERVPSFRSRRSMTSKLRDKVLASGTIATGLISPAFRNRFVLPTLDLPDLSGEGPTESAEILRELWRLGRGPIKNMVHLLESKGVEVYWLDEPSPVVDAFSLWHGDQPFVILNANKPAGDRGRYDAAHELGHLVMHRYHDLVGDRNTEREADIFAANFLLPADQYKQETPRYPILERFFPLKERWGVSIGAMVRRSRDVGVFTEWDYIRACKDISRHGWRVSEPVPVERERSHLHRMIFDRLAGRQYFPADLARDLSVQFEDLADLVPVSREFDAKRVRRLPDVGEPGRYLRLL
jgi:Zn-dependent peptidase ImmA (M78 family)/DNA-binding XRE family transcriptional regulator